MEPVKQEEIRNLEEEIRNPDGTFRKGVSGNPNGRPPGQSLKEYAKRKFAIMTPEEKEAYLKRMPLDLVWRMAEGNPPQKTVLDGEIRLPQPIVDLPHVHQDDGMEEDRGNGEAS